MRIVRQWFEPLRIWASGQGLLCWLKPPWRILKRAWRQGRKWGAFACQLLGLLCARLVLVYALPLLLYFWLPRHCARRIPPQAEAVEFPHVVMLLGTNQPLDTAVDQTAQALVSAGFRVTVLCPEGATTTCPPSWGRDVDVEVVPRSQAVTVAGPAWMCGLPLLDAALARSPWAYLALGLETALPALLAAAEHRVPCVCSLAVTSRSLRVLARSFRNEQPLANTPGLPLRGAQGFIERLALRCASCVVVESLAVAEELERRHQPSRPIVVGDLADALDGLCERQGTRVAEPSLALCEPGSAEGTKLQVSRPSTGKVV
jgi:hypothetical protein